MLYLVICWYIPAFLFPRHHHCQVSYDTEQSTLKYILIHSRKTARNTFLNHQKKVAQCLNVALQTDLFKADRDVCSPLGRGQQGSLSLESTGQGEREWPVLHTASSTRKDVETLTERSSILFTRRSQNCVKNYSVPPIQAQCQSLL